MELVDRSKAISVQLLKVFTRIAQHTGNSVFKFSSGVVSSDHLFDVHGPDASVPEVGIAYLKTARGLLQNVFDVGAIVCEALFAALNVAQTLREWRRPPLDREDAPPGFNAFY